MSVESRTRAELEALGGLDTVEGESALVIARNMDKPRTGMSVAGDSRQLLVLMTTLRDRVSREADTVDEVRQRRDAKLRAAASG